MSPHIFIFLAGTRRMTNSNIPTMWAPWQVCQDDTPDGMPSDPSAAGSLRHPAESLHMPQSRVGLHVDFVPVNDRLNALPLNRRGNAQHYSGLAAVEIGHSERDGICTQRSKSACIFGQDSRGTGQRFG